MDMVLPSSTMTPQEIANMLAKARQVQATGNYPYAETLCANILHAKPDETQARILLRKCQTLRFRQKHGNSRPAGKLTSSINFLSTKSGVDPFRDAEMAEGTLKENPCDIAANQLLLHAAQRLNWSEIEQLCLDQIAEGTPTPENLMAQADGLRSRRDFAGAVAILERAQKQFPAHLHLQKALRDAHAVLASESGWTEAKDFTELVKPQAQVNEAQSLSERIEKEPRNTALVDQLIIVLERAGNEDEVLDWITYRREIEENPALRRKAFDIRKRRSALSLEEEITELEAFIRQQPTDLELQLLLGNALLRNHEAQKAIGHLQHARKIARITGRVEALVSLASAYDHVGLPALGEKSRNQALELSREDEALQKEILYQMAQSLEERGRKDEARSRWLELFELDADYKDTTQRVLGDASAIGLRV